MIVKACEVKKNFWNMRLVKMKMFKIDSYPKVLSTKKISYMLINAICSPWTDLNKHKESDRGHPLRVSGVFPSTYRQGAVQYVHEVAFAQKNISHISFSFRACAVCNRAFNDPSFVRYPNGVVTHVHCAKNKYICPVSGKLFCAGRSRWHL